MTKEDYAILCRVLAKAARTSDRHCEMVIDIVADLNIELAIQNPRFDAAKFIDEAFKGV